LIIYEINNCILEKDDVVVDLGSNIGMFTKYAAEKCKKVISVEGSPEYFSCLVENTTENENVSYLNANIIGKTIQSIDTWGVNQLLLM
jgi:FkbM family methyltransferase